MITTTAIILVAATGVAPQEEVKVVKHSVAPPFFSGTFFTSRHRIATLLLVSGVMA